MHIHYMFQNKIRRSDRESKLRFSKLRCMTNIPELNEDPVFVLAQNSADTRAIIDAKNSNPDNKLADRIMANDTIDLTTPSAPRLSPSA